MFLVFNKHQSNVKSFGLLKEQLMGWGWNRKAIKKQKRQFSSNRIENNIHFVTISDRTTYQVQKSLLGTQIANKWQKKPRQ
jgi:hypothetical protein